MSGIRSVLDAVAASDGGATVDDLARTTGLDADLVRVALHQLVVLGRLGSSTETLACPESGCGACASSASSCGTGSRGGLVLLTLRPDAPRR